jgi:hypothetical protein
MAFNFGQFVAGASENLVDMIKTKEAQLYKEEQDEKERIRKARVAAANQRRSEEKAAKEAAGMLSMLGYDEKTTANILKSGKGGINFAIEAGQTALAKRVNPNTLFSFATTEDGTVNKDVIDETLTTTPSKDDITATTASAAVPSSGINVDAYASLYAEPDEIENTYSARLAVLSQKMGRDPENKNYSGWKSEYDRLLTDYAAFKEAEREKTGENTPSFGEGTVAANMKMFSTDSLRKYGFETDIDGNIKNMTDGTMHLADIASLDVVQMATDFNKPFQDPLMSAAINARRNSAVRGLEEYAYETYYDEDKVTPTYEQPQQVDEAISSGQMRVGQVFVYDGNVYVYTGIDDIVTGNKFYQFNLE